MTMRMRLSIPRLSIDCGWARLVSSTSPEIGNPGPMPRTTWSPGRLSAQGWYGSYSLRVSFQSRADVQANGHGARRSLIGIGGRLTAPPTPPGILIVPRRFARVELQRHKCEAGRECRRRDYAAPSEAPGVLTCAKTPSVSPRRPQQGSLQYLYRSSLKRLCPFFHCRHTQSSADPRFQIGEHPWGLTEAEVATPSNEIRPQLFDDLWQGFTPCPAGDLPDPRFEFGKSLRRDAPLAPVVRDT